MGKGKAKNHEIESHRGAFGDYGGEQSGFIERTFRERIVLVGVTFPDGSDDVTDEHLDELSRLVDTAGADEVARVTQRRDRPDPATYVGKGKVQEIHDLAEALDADTVVFDDEISPAQQANLEKILGRTAIDRSAVILDIFAQNAHSTEGKAQVELALLQYRLPRLRGSGKRLSQQAGGRPPRHAGQVAAPFCQPISCVCGVHERGKVHHPEQPYRCGRFGRRSAIRHLGCNYPSHGPAGRRAGFCL